MVQVDHLSGELLGGVFDLLYEAGAYNVQCCPTITKKNRPSYIFFIDTTEKHMEAIENIIVNNLGSTGWHTIQTDHRHIPHKTVTKQVEVQTPSTTFQFELQAKVSDNPYDIERPEIDNCLQLQSLLMEKSQLPVPYKYIYMKCQDAWINNLEELQFDNTPHSEYFE